MACLVQTWTKCCQANLIRKKTMHCYVLKFLFFLRLFYLQSRVVASFLSFASRKEGKQVNKSNTQILLENTSTHSNYINDIF